MNDLAKFAAQCRGFPAELQKAQKVAVTEIALSMTTIIRANIRAAVPDLGIKGHRGRGQLKIGASYSVRANASGVTAIVRAKGPLQIVERDTKSHTIPKVKAPSGKGRRLKKRHILLIPGIGYRLAVKHPGTKGKHPFERGVDAYKERTGHVMQKAVHEALLRSFQ